MVSDLYLFVQLVECYNLNSKVLCIIHPLELVSPRQQIIYCKS